MKLCLKILAIVTIAASTYSIIGCAAPASYSYQNVSIAFSAECADCAGIGQIYNSAYPSPATTNAIAPAGSVLMMPNAGQGGVTLFTAHVTNAPAVLTWALYPQPNLSQPGNLPTSTTGAPGESGSQVGTVSAASGNTAYYTQNGVPIYTGAALAQAQAMGIPQGMVLLVATVQADPSNPASTVSAGQLIQIYGGSTAQGPPSAYLTPSTPSNPAGLTNPAVTVAHNATFQFYGGIVGAAPCSTTAACIITTPSGPVTYPLYTADNKAIWAVGPQPFSLTTAIIGGNSTYGTITQNGLYTAPATIPATQPEVYVISELNGSVQAHANIAIN